MHKTVLLNESIEGLGLKEGDVFVDCTVGAGGHSELVAKTIPSIKLVCIDLDEDALMRVEEKIKTTGVKFHLVHDNFRNIDKILSELGIDSVGGILFDLGISSYQLETSGRGFSFQRDEPLLMTMDKKVDDGKLTAFEIVNRWSEDEISRIIFEYGEERYARRIAKAIHEFRINKVINTTGELVSIIEKVVPWKYKQGRISPATRTFQALRIAVNGELENIEKALLKCLKFLRKGGRIGVISFHSLEDRIVKNIFRDWKKEGLGEVITKKPIGPKEAEILENPRSRSAKLRFFEKN